MKKLKKLIVLDLDDTLINTSEIYWKARSEFADLIQNNRINKSEIIDEVLRYL